jgi:hypothetical protein
MRQNLSKGKQLEGRTLGVSLNVLSLDLHYFFLHFKGAWSLKLLKLLNKSY